MSKKQPEAKAPTDVESTEVFMISPIGQPGSEERLHADMVLNSIVREALPLPAYNVVRADEFAPIHMITDRIISAIEQSTLCVCDLSFHNANVFYELGLRHTLARPVILLAGKGTKLPFDTSGFPTIMFDVADWHSHASAREQIRIAATEMLQGGYKVSNPITQARASSGLSMSADSKDQLLAQMQDTLQEIQAKLRSNDYSAESARVNATLRSASSLAEVNRWALQSLKPVNTRIRDE